MSAKFESKLPHDYEGLNPPGNPTSITFHKCTILLIPAGVTITSKHAARVTASAKGLFVSVGETSVSPILIL